jgi:hypothetical protein
MSDGEYVVFELGEGGKVVRVKRRYDYLEPVAPAKGAGVAEP